MECKDYWQFPNRSLCNSFSSANSTFSRILALALALTSFSYILSLCASFSFCWCFSKKASCASSSASFTFPSMLSDLELPELFNFELLLQISIILICFLQPEMHLPLEVGNHFIYFITIVDFLFFHILLAFLVCCYN